MINDTKHYFCHNITLICDSFGILGFISLLEGYYMIIITEISPVAKIGSLNSFFFLLNYFRVY